MKLLVGLLGAVVVIIVLANAVPVLWPMATTASENVANMTGTDSGTTTIKNFWPVALLMIGLGLGIGVIVYGLRRFGLIGGGGGIG